MTQLFICNRSRRFLLTLLLGFGFAPLFLGCGGDDEAIVVHTGGGGTIYGGSMDVITSQCVPFEPDDAFTLVGSLVVVSSGVGSATAAGSLSINRLGVNFTLTLSLFGTLDDQGTFMGTYHEVFRGTNGFSSVGNGTFSGTLTEGTLSLDIDGMDTDIGGITCQVDGSFNGAS